MSDEQIARAWEITAASRDLLGKGVAPSTIQAMELTDTLRAVLSHVSRLRAAMDAIASASDCPDDSPDQIALHVIGCMGALGMFQAGEHPDSRRLDWLERAKCVHTNVRWGEEASDFSWCHFANPGEYVNTMPLRAAIDAAIMEAQNASA